jgi:hypothetical protein
VRCRRHHHRAGGLQFVVWALINLLGVQWTEPW